MSAHEVSELKRIAKPAVDRIRLYFPGNIVATLAEASTAGIDTSELAERCGKKERAGLAVPGSPNGHAA